MSRLVLGAGPAGLLASCVLGRVPCLGARVGLSPGAKVAPSYLWHSEGIASLLRSLGGMFRHVEPRVIRFGYVDRSGLRDSVTEAERVEYYARSRGLRASEVAPASVMSGGLPGELIGYQAEVLSYLCRHLRRVVPVTTCEVLAVDADTGLVRTTAEDFSAELIVNTLPADVFGKLCEQATPAPHLFLRREHLRVPRLPEELEGFLNSPFEYVYGLGADRRFLRATKIGLGVVLEAQTWTDLGKVLAVSRTPIGKPGPRTTGRVVHLGRFARWDHGLRLHDVVDEAYDVHLGRF